MPKNSELRNQLRSKYMTEAEQCEINEREKPSAVKDAALSKVAGGVGLLILSLIVSLVFSSDNGYEFVCLLYWGASFVGFYSIFVGLCSGTSGKEWGGFSSTTQTFIIIMSFVGTVFYSVAMMVLADLIK